MTVSVFDRLRQSLRTAANVEDSQLSRPARARSGQTPYVAAAIDQKMAARQIDELIGLCKGLIADGGVVDAEIRFLAQWLERNQECSHQWPYTMLYERVRATLADGHVTADEKAQLFDVIQQVSGTSFCLPSESEPSSDTGTDGLPYDEPPPLITFSERAFCVTGDFAYGPRETVIETIERRGGRVVSAPSGKTDFLIVGLTASYRWRHSTHGTKIIKAVELRRTGKAIAIVREKHWTEAISTRRETLTERR